MTSDDTIIQADVSEKIAIPEKSIATNANDIIDSVNPPSDEERVASAALDSPASSTKKQNEDSPSDTDIVDKNTESQNSSDDEDVIDTTSHESPLQSEKSISKQSPTESTGKQEESADDSFIILLDDEPEDDTNSPTVGDSASKSDNDSDSFLILFDDDDPEDNTTIEEDSGYYRISFAGDISLANVVNLKHRLNNTFDAIGIDLDARDVSGLDTSSAQMLVSYINGLRNSSVPVKWVGTSKTFDNVFEILGLNFND